MESPLKSNFSCVLRILKKDILTSFKLRTFFILRDLFQGVKTQKREKALGKDIFREIIYSVKILE